MSVPVRKLCSRTSRIVKLVQRSYASISSTNSYKELYEQSLRNPQDFWNDVARGIEWFKPYESVLDSSKSPFTNWFVGGELNTSYNAIDRHVLNGKADTPAIIFDSAITGTRKTMTFRQLQEQVSKLAGGLSDLGVRKGDTVLIYMPMIPETIIAMLAVSRIGAIHSKVFGGFAAPELSKRISHVEAKVILSASCGVEPNRQIPYKPIIEEAIALSTHKPKHCVILQRENLPQAEMKAPQDVDWKDLIDKSRPHDAVPVSSDHPAYILYTSGTTGTPKGICRPTGGHAAVLPWTMKTLYGMEHNDTFWAASDFGWVVGHSYICYAPLLNGNTTVVYEGKPVGTPDEKQFFRVISDYDVRGMFTAPTALRAISRVDPQGEAGSSYNLSGLRAVFVAGEPLDHDTRVWTEKAFGVPTLDHWWQTETGYAIAATCNGLDMSSNPPRGSVGKPFFGYDTKIMTPDNKIAEPGVFGRILCKLPLPPGNASTLWKADERFQETYFTEYPGYYDTMDAGFIDKDGYIYVHAREDDVINVAGHRLSTLAIEEAIMHHPDIIEAAAIGVPDSLKGEVPLALFVVCSKCTKDEDTLKKEIVTVVREQIGPVAAFRLCASVKHLPKTRSGKTPRKSIADLAKDKKIVIPPTIEDPLVYKEVLRALRSIGYALKAVDPTS